MESDHKLTYARQIVETLIDHQFEAYLVGGYVRDRLLDRPIKDIDIATSAKPHEVMALFKRCEPTGLQHGTVTVIIGRTPFEVTTFRIESVYEDFRRPSDVQFIEDVKGDLSRRDFTINAMALDLQGRLIDPFGGAEDLRQGQLRCVGDPLKRFAEDALRMLRCIRFAAEYELTIDRGTWNALLEQAPSMRYIAMERVRAELERIVEGNDPGHGLQLLMESGLCRHFKSDPGIGFDRLTTEDHRNFTAVTDTIQEATIRWTLLFVMTGVNSQQAISALRILTFANQMAKQIVSLLSFHEWLSERLRSLPDEHESAWKLGAVRYGRIIAAMWIKMVRLGNELILKIFPSPIELHRAVDQGEQWLKQIPATRLRELNITGSDLIGLGVKPGPAIGRLLKMLLKETALGMIENSNKPLKTRALQLWQAESDQA